MSEILAGELERPKSSPRLLCLFNRHEPRGHSAAWDSKMYISRCEHCSKPIFRLKKGRWRRDRRRKRQG